MENTQITKDQVAGLAIRRVAIEALHLDPANARLHPAENLDAIEASIRRFGQAEPLVVQKISGRVIGGNGRLAVMRKLGWTECDVVEVDVDDVTATALAIALNRSADLAAWDEPVLGRLLDQLRIEGALEGIGFSESELDDLLASLEADLDSELHQDEVPEPPDVPITRPGDLWILGNHRLLCGDSANPDDVNRLLAGEPVHLVNTDPPYNVKVEPRSNNALAAGSNGLPHGKKAHAGKMRAKDRALENDFVTDDEFDRLVDAWFGNIARVLLPGHAFYIWGGGYPGSGGAKGNHETYPQFMRQHGLKYAQLIIWDKEHPVLTRKDFMGAHESCFYGWREGAGHRFFGPNNATDLWSVKKVSPNAMVHLTEKPTELAARAIRYSTRRGENVLDLFGGSGSTMAAAEQTGRRAFLCEMDAPYCDVIVQRFEKLAGAQAVLDGDGRTFAEISAEWGEARDPGDALPASDLHEEGRDSDGVDREGAGD